MWPGRETDYLTAVVSTISGTERRRQLHQMHRAGDPWAPWLPWIPWIPWISWAQGPEQIPFRVWGLIYSMDSMDFLGPKALNGFRSGFSLAEIHHGAHGIFPEPFSMQPMAFFQQNTAKIINRANRATQGSTNKLAMCASPGDGADADKESLSDVTRERSPSTFY